MELSEESRQDIMEFQNLQQQLQMVLMQKQQIQLRLADLQRVGEEMGKSAPEAKFFRSIGSVLVPKDKKELEVDVGQEKESLEARATLLGKQEGKLSERLMALQQKLQKLERGFSLGQGGAGEGASVSKGAKPNRSVQ